MNVTGMNVHHMQLNREKLAVSFAAEKVNIEFDKRENWCTYAFGERKVKE